MTEHHYRYPGWDHEPAPSGPTPWEKVLQPPQPGGGVRFAETVAVTLSAGLIGMAIILLVARPTAEFLFSDNSAYFEGSLPWGSITIHAGVGIAGECIYLARRWSKPPVRLLLALLTIVAVFAVLLVVWWQ